MEWCIAHGVYKLSIKVYTMNVASADIVYKLINVNSEYVASAHVVHRLSITCVYGMLQVLMLFTSCQSKLCMECCKCSCCTQVVNQTCSSVQFRYVVYNLTVNGMLPAAQMMNVQTVNNNVYNDYSKVCAQLVSENEYTEF